MPARTPITLIIWAACVLPGVLFCLLACGAASASAAPAGRDPGPRSLAPAYSLSITPTRLVVPSDMLGETQRVRVTNRGRLPMDVVVGKRDFVQRPDGTLSLQEHAPYSASNWVRVVPDRFRLEPGAVIQAEVRVDAPAQPDVGDHQVVLVFLVAAKPGPGNIKVNRGIGLPVFITVPGSVHTSVLLSDLRAPGFAMSGPLRFSATVRNSGTVHQDFRGRNALAVKVNGKAVAFPSFTVTRGALLEISTIWRDPPLFCRCVATLTLTRADGTAQRLSVPIVIVPVHLIAGALGGAALLFVAARFARRRYFAHVRAAAMAASSGKGGDEDDGKDADKDA